MSPIPSSRRMFGLGFIFFSLLPIRIQAATGNAQKLFYEAISIPPEFAPINTFNAPASIQNSLSPEPKQLNVVSFRIPTSDGRSEITGQIDLPRTSSKNGHPLVVMMAGSGPFDRDMHLGASNSPKDLVFLDLSKALTSQGVAVARYDFRGIRCNALTMPPGPGSFIDKCIDASARQHVTEVTSHEDFQIVYDFAKKHPAIDASRIVVFAHSEGTVHVSTLIERKTIQPKALVLLGFAARSPIETVHWQLVARTVGCIMRHASNPERISNEELSSIDDPFCSNAGVPPSPQGHWSPRELTELFEQNYQKNKSAALSASDTAACMGPIFPCGWWKMWFTSSRRGTDKLAAFSGKISVHNGEIDSQTSVEMEIDFLRSESSKFKSLPQIYIHNGKGHTLGSDRVMGPMSEDSQSLLVKNILESLQ